MNEQVPARIFSQDIEDLREEDCVDIYLYKLQCATQSENPREKIYLRRSMVEVSEEKLLFLPQDSNDKVKGKQRVLGRDFYLLNGVDAIDRHHKDGQQAHRMGTITTPAACTFRYDRPLWKCPQCRHGVWTC